MIRVFLVEDHELFASGVRTELGGEFELVGQADTVEEAGRGVLEAEPDVVLLDVHLPDGSGASVVERVQAEREDVRFLASRTRPKTCRRDPRRRPRLRDEVDLTRRARRRDPPGPRRRRRVLAEAGRLRPRRVRRPLGPADRPRELDQVFPREREVLRYIARGYANKEIARELHMSVKTAETHVSAVLRKLQLSSRHELSRWASDRRLV